MSDPVPAERARELVRGGSTCTCTSRPDVVERKIADVALARRCASWGSPASS